MIPRAETLKLFVRNQAAKLGTAISEARKQQGITQSYLASQLHVTTPTLRKLESGDASVGLDTCIAALLILKIESDVLNTQPSLHEPLPFIPAKDKKRFAKQLQSQGVSYRDARVAAWVLALPSRMRSQVLSGVMHRWQRTPLEKVTALLQSIEQQHGRAMLVGGAALFLYGKPERELDYELWVRIANDELVEILTAHGFEIDSNRSGHLLAYYDECRFKFYLLKRAYTQQHELIEYDAMEARGNMVAHQKGKLIIPCIEDMLKLKKLDEDMTPKGLEDITFLEAMTKTDLMLQTTKVRSTIK